MWSHTYWVRQQGSRQTQMLRIRPDTPEWTKFHVADFVYESLCCLVAQSHTYSGMRNLRASRTSLQSHVGWGWGGGCVCRGGEREREREHKHNSNRNQLEPSKLFIIQMDSFLLEFSTQIDLFTYNFHCRLLCPTSLKPQKQHTRLLKPQLGEKSQWTLLSSHSFFFPSLFSFCYGELGEWHWGKDMKKPAAPRDCNYLPFSR